MKVPLATYRLQFNSQFTFKQAIELVEYFKELGISHCYCSPIFKAKKGTTHGYDVVNPLEINPEIGTKEEFIEFVKKLRQADMGLILDIVPNHMYIANGENVWWEDVLKEGPSSEFAEYFDIDWTDNQVFLPTNDQEQKDSKYTHFVDWRSPEINYRKFFDILDYAGIRIEESKVYQKVNELLFSLKSYIDGLRIDHIDGLYDPYQYLTRLQEDMPIYTVVEKILFGDEKIPSEWPIQGTVGYEFLNQANALFVYKANKKIFWEIYNKFTGVSTDVETLYYTCKKFMLETSLLSDVTRVLKRLKGQFDQEDLKKALIEIIAYFPVYRTYIRNYSISEQDQKVIDIVFEKASKHLHPDILDFMRSLFPKELDFIMHLQQITGPAMAKGIEDTACYRFFPLASLNEVGNDLRFFGMDLDELRIDKPHSLLASSTHDTKRGEDVRARINVLSEMPDIWEKKIWHWHAMNQIRHLDKNEEYLLYQTLVGSWPNEISKSFINRIKEYMVKAINEAKLNSSWRELNSEYLANVKKTIDKLFSNKDFINDMAGFVASLREYGFHNSLAETLIKITFPGIPDFYQGSELWHLVLVDPDNRHPVDFNERKKALTEDSHPKLSLIRKALHFRKQNAELFTYGDYFPLKAKGPAHNHVIAFARKYNEQTSLTIVGRFLSKLSNWDETFIEIDGNFQDIFTKKVFSNKIHMAKLFETQTFSLLSNL